jgi:uncharacterized protein
MGHEDLLAASATPSDPRRRQAGEIPRRPLGRTGVQVSALGVGGHHLGDLPSFEQQVLPELARRGIAALGMKSLGGDGQPILHGAVRPEEALRYAMSLPVATTISGIDSLAVLRQNVAIARDFQPMTPGEMQALRERCAPLAADGHLALFKATKRYDGAVGRQKHGHPSAEQLPF